MTWQPETARLRVSRVVTVIDAGHILNPKPARNQIEGAVVMGVGMALFEETVYDPRFGAPINNNLADYIVATNADAPEIDVTFLDYPDKVLNPLGARGVGEIGLAGIAAAITSPSPRHWRSCARTSGPHRRPAGLRTKLRRHDSGLSSRKKSQTASEGATRSKAPDSGGTAFDSSRARYEALVRTQGTKPQLLDLSRACQARFQD